MDCSQGFCLLNNAAIAARHALLHHREVRKVCIIDIDLHHGNGTEEIVNGWTDVRLWEFKPRTWLHAAKGREWSVVFACRLNEGECPLTVKGDAALQEERRLCYVAMSRAREQLCLTHVASEASGAPAMPSRFLGELPSGLLHHVQGFY